MTTRRRNGTGLALPNLIALAAIVVLALIFVLSLAARVFDLLYR